ncbi:MAG: exodeoxyribonuclease VII small subunit [Lachnospiraceae bacterium]|nr:exodeoxyribonuclease VII small subunit [Lachnospiraceae bacterium]MBR1649779.1 exodeoxyribonuclease VII small subunit [Lachnospiraceae bacterium]
MAESKTKEKDNITLEKILDNIDEIIEKLEDEELPLEEAFTEYSKGVKLIAEANKKVDRVEKKVQKLLDNGETEDFE